MLFKVKLTKAAKKAKANQKDDEPLFSYLGFDWIEVLGCHLSTSHPVHHSKKDRKKWPDLPDRCYSNVYDCRTESGLIQIVEGDLWQEIYEGIYEEDKPKRKHNVRRK